MSGRPIVLLGSERVQPAAEPPDHSGFYFDGPVGVWRATDGRMAVAAGGGPTTTITATREGMDQSEGSAPGTTVTETREGLDQAETTDPT